MTPRSGRGAYSLSIARILQEQLKRQVGALLFERLAKHRDPEAVLAEGDGDEDEAQRELDLDEDEASDQEDEELSA